ncbi:AAA family ATPase [Alistipes sp. kh20]|uniref:ATP-dependent nuclease n=1 Tax=Alistipes montrealensis TaxID=2834113 RepID=UPI001BCECD37|nr:AAA family ATPase [Alistipes montrealensis]MBS4765803.1 AAA family ATPase [Alistipes montrealensis]
MRIKELSVENYRNLNSATIALEESCNFIVGENNLGKSNILNLLNIIFTRRGFAYDDFSDANLPITVKVRIKLANDEIGHFEDLFDADDYTYINIVCRQVSPDENMEFYHLETETYISPALIKCLNFIYYDSLRNPISEINFDSSRGVGRFLSRMIKDYLSDKDIDTNNLVDTEFTDNLLANVNTKLGKIKSFKDYEIKAVLEGDISLLLPKLISLQDNKGGSLSKCGYGIQFLLLVTLSILDKLQTISDQRGETGVFVNEDTGEKSISVVLGLDEPEIHLHPYMQRSLVKYLNRVINNEDSDLRILIKELFGIDRIDGQIIIATHSPSIILNDFKQIIRLYKDGINTKIVSGTNLSLGEQLERHLLLHFPFIKEAFFARCAIFVEGDSEYGSFPLFAQKCGVDIDDYGICIIQAGGDSVLQLIQLAEKFGIPCVGIRDSDGDNTPTGIPNLWKTTARDFEAELMWLIDSEKENKLCEIVCEFDSAGQSRVLDAAALNKRAHKKYNFLPAPTSISLKLLDIDKRDIMNLKAFYSTWFSINKSQPLGLLIGMKLEKDDIPQIYVDVIEYAKGLC